MVGPVARLQAVRHRPVARRLPLPFLIVLLALPVMGAQAQGDPEQVDLAFARVVTTVWGNGTRYNEFQVDAYAGASLNVSVEVTVSRNRLQGPHEGFLRLRFTDAALANLTQETPFELGPDTPRRVVLEPTNVTLPIDLPHGTYQMVLELGSSATDPFPQSNQVTVPLLIGDRAYEDEPYVFRPAYLIGAGLIVTGIAAAAGYARIARLPGYQTRMRRVHGLWEALVVRWSHDPRRGWYRVGLTVLGLAAIIMALAAADFFVMPSGEYLLRSTITGLLVGAIYALVALGYTMVYGVLKFINFAHGEVLMWGAYAALYLSVLSDLPFFIGVVGAVLFAGLLGATIERAAYRPLRGRPRLTPLITAIGVSLFLQGAAQLFFGTRSRGYGEALVATRIGDTTLAEIFRARVFTIMDVPVNGLGLIIVLLSILLMVGLHLFVRHTRMGKAIRAVADDFETASIIGIDVNRAVTTTFVIGSMLAAIAGILYGARFAVQPTMGFMPGMKAFIAAVVGGIGNIYGAFLGGFLIGLAESVGAAFLRQRGFQHAIAFVILIVVLILRPTGILAAKESEVRRK